MIQKSDNIYSVLLTERGLRPSPIRTLVLRILEKSEGPVSVQDMEVQLQTVDRSSITRTMATFQKAGIIHTITDGSGSMKYELCRSRSHYHHTDEHVHFRCTNCGRTICLTDIPVPKVQLPKGFTEEKSNYVITGICDKCKEATLSHLNDK